MHAAAEAFGWRQRLQAAQAAAAPAVPLDIERFWFVGWLDEAAGAWLPTGARAELEAAEMCGREHKANRLATQLRALDEAQVQVEAGGSSLAPAERTLRRLHAEHALRQGERLQLAVPHAVRGAGPREFEGGPGCLGLRDVRGAQPHQLAVELGVPLRGGGQDPEHAPGR